MKRTKKPILIRSYLLFSLVVLLSIGLIGAMLYGASVREIVKQGFVQQQNHIDALAQDLNRQFVAMRDVAYTIKSSVYYRGIYLKRNPYYYWELTENIAKFANNTPLSSDYFYFFYNDIDNIYYANKSSFLLPHLRLQFGEEEAYSLVRQIKDQSRKIQTIKSAGESVVLFLFPVLYNAHAETDDDGVLCYVVRRSAFSNRIDMLVGALPGNVSIRFSGEEIYREVSHEMDSRAITLTAESGDGLFSVTLDSSERLLLGDNALYRTYLNIFILCATILLVIVAAPLAMLAYRPIRRITRQYADDISEREGDEMDAIGSLIEDMRRQRTLSQSQLQSSAEQIHLQNERIRRQALLILFLQPALHYNQEDLASLGLLLPGPQYCAWALFANGKADALIHLVEDLSDGSLLFYACQVSESVAVLVSMPETETPESITELLRSACQMLDIPVRVQCGQVTESLNAISASFAAALTSTNAEEAKPAEVSDPGETRSRELADNIVRYIREHALEYEISRKSIAADFGISEQYLARVISQHTGKTYKDILIEERMARACALLDEGTLSIREVSEVVCYMNPSHFITTFRKATGLTPDVYRKRHGNSADTRQSSQSHL